MDRRARSARSGHIDGGGLIALERLAGTAPALSRMSGVRAMPIATPRRWRGAGARRAFNPNKIRPLKTPPKRLFREAPGKVFRETLIDWVYW
jgi:hypothetical protein